MASDLQDAPAEPWPIPFSVLLLHFPICFCCQSRDAPCVKSCYGNPYSRRIYPFFKNSLAGSGHAAVALPGREFPARMSACNTAWISLARQDDWGQSRRGRQIWGSRQRTSAACTTFTAARYSAAVPAADIRTAAKIVFSKKKFD